jgi:predicted nucleotidyltransferase
MGNKHKNTTAPRKLRAARPGRQLGGESQTRSLSDALFSSTQQRVLTLIFGQPDRSYFARELIKLANSGSGAVQRELQRLERSGLVKVTQQGNQKHYQANQSAPVFPELRSIILKTVGLAEPLRAALAPLQRRIGFAVLYGSTAKGTDTAYSDIDLLIVADHLSLEEIYAAIAPAERDLARRISPTLYTPEEFRRRRNRGDSFVSRVLTGDHIVLIGDEDAINAT